MNRKQDQFRGCLLGMAAGDALGYCVEDQTLQQIQENFGPEGILGYDLINGYAQISANTQLAMFTANGLLFGATRGSLRGVMAPYARYMEAACRDWAKTQRYGGRKTDERICTWLYRVTQLHARRHPELVVLDALNKPQSGTMEEPVNQAKGCGGLTRAAAVGLFFDPKRLSQGEIDRIGAEAAALTHGNPLGFLPGATLAHMVSKIIYDRPASMRALVHETKEAMDKQFGLSFPQTETILRLLTQAEHLADHSSLSAQSAMEQLGAITGAEVLAAAVCACLRFPGDYSGAIVAAVNHAGHSACAGAVAGCLMGAWLGTEGIPEFFLEPLELREVLEELSDDLYHGCPMSAQSNLFDDQWDRKYIQCEYDEA